MPQSHQIDPVMHCSERDFLGVYMLSVRIIEEGIYAHTTEFATPTVPLTDFQPASVSLDKLIAVSKKDKTRVPYRTKQCTKVFEYLEKLLLYAKTVCDHDPVLIKMSGFDTNYLPSKAPLPEARVITKVVKGAGAGTYKIMLKRKNKSVMTGSDPISSTARVKYSIEITTTPNDAASWKKIEEGLASNNLFFTDVILGSKNYVRVYGVNSSGKGQPSASFPFTPEFE
jgi:hypothetical protein